MFYLVCFHLIKMQHAVVFPQFIGIGGELVVRLEAQDRAFEEIQRKHQEELEAVKKSQQKKNEACEKKQHMIQLT